MRIADVTATPLRPIPLAVLFATTNAALQEVRPVVVTVTDTDGVTGYGEALPAWEVTGETQETVAGVVGLYSDPTRLDAADLLPGRRLAGLDDVVAIAERMNPTGRPCTVAHNASAKAAIEQALLDVVARRAGTSVHTLLGADPTVTVPAAHTIMLGPVDESLAQVAAVLAGGPAVVRLKLGGDVAVGAGSTTDRDVTLVREAAELVRAVPGARLVADANEGYVDVQRAAAFCREVEGCLDWLEQPFVGEDLLGFAELARRTSVPLMADESVHGLAQARMLLQLGGVAYLNVKLMKCGGVLPALQIIDLAAEHGVGVHVGSMLETSLSTSAAHLVAAARAGQVVSTDTRGFTLLDPDPFALMRTTAEDRVALVAPDAVGTGVTAEAVREAAWERHPARTVPA